MIFEIDAQFKDIFEVGEMQGVILERGLKVSICFRVIKSTSTCSREPCRYLSCSVWRNESLRVESTDDDIVRIEITLLSVKPRTSWQDTDLDFSSGFAILLMHVGDGVPSSITRIGCVKVCLSTLHSSKVVCNSELLVCTL